MSAAREAVTLLLSGRLGLRHTTIRRIVDRLPAALLQSIVVESFIKSRVDPILSAEDCQGILPCPFCGGRGDFQDECDSIMCDDCGAIGGEHQKHSIAAAMWNRRVPVAVITNYEAPPLPPHVLADARHDTAHKQPSKARPGKTAQRRGGGEP